MTCMTRCEVRGLERKMSQKGLVYYILRCEDLCTGKPFELTADADFDVSVFKRGDTYDITCDFFGGRDWYKFVIVNATKIEDAV